MQELLLQLSLFLNHFVLIYLPVAYGNPTSVDFVRCDSSQVAVGYQSSDTVIFDLETGAPVVTLESKVPSGKINIALDKQGAWKFDRDG